ncbi:MAG: CYTH domain-containing protein [Elusimicrobiota bacterium]|nr:MAG: CYTH domain-containing protein [Elusimicrobiota bacterium]
MDSAELCSLLRVSDHRLVEIESKWRLAASTAKSLRQFLKELDGVEHVKRSVFIDQYLDTPGLDLLRADASLRLRYRKNGGQVYLQYKGPGVRRGAVHYRSEYRSDRLDFLVPDQSGADILSFERPSVPEILETMSDPGMLDAMRRDLGAAVPRAIDRAPVICQYQKDLYRVELGEASLAPSIDRLCVFRVDRAGPLAMSTLWEYENQAAATDLAAKLAAVPAMRDFDAHLADEFDLSVEPLDKYRRCAGGLLARPEARVPAAA